MKIKHPMKKINLLADEIREESVRYTELSGSGLDADAREKIMDYLRFGDEEKIDDFMKWFLENIGETDLKSRV